MKTEWVTPPKAWGVGIPRCHILQCDSAGEMASTADYRQTLRRGPLRGSGPSLVDQLNHHSFYRKVIAAISASTDVKAFCLLGQAK